MAKFNLLASDIENLPLKLEGKLPIDRDELLALANSWGRNNNFDNFDKNNNLICISCCEIKEKYDLSKLDVSEITSFNSIFRETNFDGDISSWNVSNGTNLFAMFLKAKNFNSPLEKWDVSKVTNFAWMFCRTENFNQPLDKWNTSNAKDMSHIFDRAEKFNQALDKWDTSNVINMDSMFCYAKTFNQNLNSWNISKVTNMDFIFANAEVFNQPIFWDLSHVQSCNRMLINSIFNTSRTFQKRFNKGKNLPIYTNEIKEWLIENKSLMEAINIKYSKSKELNNFLLNFNNNKLIDI